ncbi:16S rRNA (uracil1498-N3)-methyltransferase [Arcanobacterium wilhelmae]|uniref:Ribosomal RNA small subunit methyltransferase E n=1 Tax=Arcanobacterium wilhelmae TaxID=1803177 RepID=A0ABT9NDC8_9ACTO|nr:16S rRNA (uracil(1498)-N(3))-methyltransferase [Arcanobacterium wilhelmae]MDP9801728.1 16S rRNA (uracil1498-N3)-methyltransferase [Arcanobacterium wilhelmae]WFN91046.1 16S rRNA (uracil(1498)-N(3))-methyltransferase [Arcanobacterium wilhelmae]
MTLPVYVDRELKPLEAGTLVSLRGEEARHAATVRRTRVGEELDIVSGRGVRVRVEVTATSKDSLTGRVLESVEELPSDPQIVLVQALAKGGRDEQAVETATEFGVDHVIPWESDRAIVSWSHPGKAEKGRTKWEAVALAAAKQSRRSWVPTVGEPVSTKQLAQWIRSEKAMGGRIFVCHESATTPLVEKLEQRTQLAGDVAPRTTVVVGPEGGITDLELALLADAGGEVVLLGKHVLRSATAGPWAIAVLRALGGK